MLTCARNCGLQTVVCDCQGMGHLVFVRSETCLSDQLMLCKTYCRSPLFIQLLR